MSFKLIVDDNTICLYWTLNPKRVTWILPDIQTEHISDLSYVEDAKYPINFTLLFEGGVVFWYLT